MADIAELQIRISSLEAKRAAQDLAALRNAAAGAETAAGRTEGRFRGLATASSGLTRQITRLVAIFGGFLIIRNVLTLLGKFEETMILVRETVRANEEQFRRLTAAAREMGATTRFTAAEAADALLNLARAGLSVDESIAALPNTLNLAQAGVIGLAEAADLVAKTMRQFKLESSETARVSDALVIVANRSATNVQQLGEGMKFAAIASSAVGRTLEETAAAMGVLADNAQVGSLAGTGLRRVISGLVNPTGQALETLRGLNLALKQVSPASNDLITVFTRLRDAGMGIAEAFELFDVRGGPAAVALTQNIEKMRFLVIQQEKFRGEAERIRIEMDKSLIGKFKSFTSALQEAALQVGDAGLAGGLKRLLVDLTDVTRMLTGITQPTDQVSERARALAATLVFVGRSFMTGIKIIELGFQGLQFLFQKLVGFIVDAADALDSFVNESSNAFSDRRQQIAKFAGEIQALSATGPEGMREAWVDVNREIEEARGRVRDLFEASGAAFIHGRSDKGMDQWLESMKGIPGDADRARASLDALLLLRRSLFQKGDKPLFDLESVFKDAGESPMRKWVREMRVTTLAGFDGEGLKDKIRGTASELDSLARSIWEPPGLAAGTAFGEGLATGAAKAAAEAFSEDKFRATRDALKESLGFGFMGANLGRAAGAAPRPGGAGTEDLAHQLELLVSQTQGALTLPPSAPEAVRKLAEEDLAKLTEQTWRAVAALNALGAVDFADPAGADNAKSLLETFDKLVISIRALGGATKPATAAMDDNSEQRAIGVALIRDNIRTLREQISIAKMATGLQERETAALELENAARSLSVELLPEQAREFKNLFDTLKSIQETRKAKTLLFGTEREQGVVGQMRDRLKLTQETGQAQERLNFVLEIENKLRELGKVLGDDERRALDQLAGAVQRFERLRRTFDQIGEIGARGFEQLVFEIRSAEDALKLLQETGTAAMRAIFSEFVTKPLAENISKLLTDVVPGAGGADAEKALEMEVLNLERAFKAETQIEVNGLLFSGMEAAAGVLKLAGTFVASAITTAATEAAVALGLGGAAKAAAGAGGLPPAFAGGAASGSVAGAKGMTVVGGHVVPFAKGGTDMILQSMTSFPLAGRRTGVAGEAGAELMRFGGGAVQAIPLRRMPSGRYGVDASGLGGGNAVDARVFNVAFHISTPDPSGFRRSRSQITAEMQRIARGF